MNGYITFPLVSFEQHVLSLGAYKSLLVILLQILRIMLMNVVSKHMNYVDLSVVLYLGCLKTAKFVVATLLNAYKISLELLLLGSCISLKNTIVLVLLDQSTILMVG